MFAWQQAGGTILMDADAISALHKRGIVATNDSFKFTWFQVSVQVEFYMYRLTKLTCTSFT